MSSQPEWLIRSGSRILGPYTQAEVALKLREKELSLHDEISEPVGRWWPIQYHPRMEDVVEDFRSQTTTDLTDALSTRTPTLSLTDALNEGSSKSKSKVQTEPKVVETFGVYKQSPQNKNLKNLQGTFWAASIAVVLLGTGFFWYLQKNKTQKIEMNAQVSDARIAEQALFVGDYRKALAAYKRLADKNPQGNEYSIYLAPLYLQVENQTVLAKRELEKINGRDQFAEAQTAEGLLNFIENNRQKAKENWQKALTINPNYDPASLNLAYDMMASKNWNQARQWLENYYQRDKSSADHNIAYALASLEAFEKNKNQRLLTEADLILSDSYLKIQDRIQDVLLIRSAIAQHTGNQEDFRKNIFDLLNQEIEGFKKVRHNAFVANAWFENEMIAPLCREQAAKLTAQPDKGLMETYCFVRAGQMDQAQKKMAQVRDQAPRHPLVQAWASYMLDQQQQQEQASVILGRAMEANRSGEYIQPYILQAQFCFSRKDYACAEQNWQVVLQQKPDSLMAGTALAQIKMLSGRQAEAAEDVRRLGQQSEDYKPLLEMQWALK